MFVLDTDSLTLLFVGQPRIVQRHRDATEEVATTIVSRIEVLQGRFSSIMKAEDGAKLVLAQQRLLDTETDLNKFPALQLTADTGTQFDRLLATKGLRRLGRGDLLSASICLAHRATLVTRNLKDFRKVPGLAVENWAD